MSVTASLRLDRAARAPARTGSPFAGVGWRLYLALAAGLLPLLVSIGPAQTVPVDLINVAAIGAFAVVALATRPRIEIPFIVPVTIIAAASLLAITNAASPGQSFVALIQDAYLYLWFVVLVNLMIAQGDLGGVRVAWTVGAAVAALAGIAALMAKGISPMEMLGAKGERATGWTSNANLFADYLAVSFFVAVTAAGRMPRLLHLGALAAIFAALLATKSLGGMLSWFAGLGVYVVARAATRRPRAATLALAVVVLGVGFAGWWGWEQVTGARQDLQIVSEGSMAGRFDKSSESRLHIWKQLGRQYAANPLGIGPGNSKYQKLGASVSEQQHAMFGKEAHNDFIAYAVERGPLALLALLGLMIASWFRIWKGWGRLGAAERRGTAGVIAAAMTAALVASTVHSFTIEKLHFRHFWMMLALLVALNAWYVQGARGEGAEPAR